MELPDPDLEPGILPTEIRKLVERRKQVNLGLFPNETDLGARLSKVPKTFRARKAIRKTPTFLFCKAGRFICCKGNKS